MLTKSALKSLNILKEHCEKHIQRTQQSINEIQLRNHYNLSPPLYVVLPITFYTRSNKELKLIKLLTTNLLNAHSSYNKSFVLTLKDRLQNSMVDTMTEYELLIGMNLIKSQKYYDYSEFTKHAIELKNDALHEIEGEDEEEEEEEEDEEVFDITITIPTGGLLPHQIEILISSARQQLSLTHTDEQIDEFVIRLRGCPIPRTAFPDLSPTFP